jgi:hypothetical protein
MRKLSTGNRYSWQVSVNTPKTSTEGKLDGSDLPITGPGMPPGSTFSAKASGLAN